ncbi:cation transport regulator ChaB [Gordonia amarae]|uniref:Rho termination factor-like N-terminal domain-containing protein n=2 Tax=Gordonia amarae TaxID=36821 RepID=G7GUJ1_9ACTN|nr:ChaB family protein [Gordonia amarae]MCS3877388.1 cation transport regulator ChaB [Gordonia amarae]QHN16136.1 cation transport regulator ChaB [Gordonia amarae]QHN20704.1 cation transport regulator ChaB [Gordonia amarae]QHN29556.1 cation transport regulator ChaB [Gordonia amarae]QHN38332.1 cation transport regulator ChaB [Gordonia amarae]
MPKTDKNDNPIRSELPSTIARSDKKAQRTFAEAHDSALEEYESEERAHRVAYAALKHSYEKVGDHWEAKEHRGPSDSRARSGGPNPGGTSAEGVDANATKDHLLDVARRLDIHGRSRMNKDELIHAIEKANRSATEQSRK